MSILGNRPISLQRCLNQAPGQSMAHPEEELDKLTKKMLFDMNHPPSEEYFAEASRSPEAGTVQFRACDIVSEDHSAYEYYHKATL
ncbi:lipoma-preferred partner isoform X1 [Tachysurus ichikawai]